MKATEWSIADAKSKLSEVLTHAEREPQIITRRGRRFVVVEGTTYERVTGVVPGLKEAILAGPGLEGVDLARDQSLGRKVSL